MRTSSTRATNVLLLLHRKDYSHIPRKKKRHPICQRILTSSGSMDHGSLALQELLDTKEQRVVTLAGGLISARRHGRPSSWHVSEFWPFCRKSVQGASGLAVLHM